MNTKRHLYLACFLGLCISYAAGAQNLPTIHYQSFRRGGVLIGVKDGYGRGELFEHRNLMQLYTGYFVTDRLSVGLAGSIVKEWYENYQTRPMFSGGPFARYQFTRTRLSPFLDVNYQIGQTYVGFSHQILVTPGVSIWLIAGLRLDINYGLQWIDVGRNGGMIGQPQAGLNYVFARK